jgi:hypothetical protein
MHRSTRILMVLFGCLGAAGCADTPAAPSAPAAILQGPHHGMTLRLPDDLGYAELVNEPPSDGASSSAPTALVVYFLTADGKAPMATPPTEVKAKVELASSRRAAQETLDLKLDPKSDDPAGACRFASKTGAYSLATLRGELTGNAQSHPFKLEIAGGR